MYCDNISSSNPNPEVTNLEIGVHRRGPCRRFIAQESGICLISLLM